MSVEEAASVRTVGSAANAKNVEVPTSVSTDGGAIGAK